jgi:iron complex outermembrane recepter protein
MSKSYFKGSLLATTVMAGMVLAAPVYAQTPAPDAPPPTTPPTNTQGTGAPATPTDQFPPAGTQTNESSQPAEPTSAQEIVVTGTLIRNPNLVASAPVTVVGQDEMQLRQTNVAEEVLRTIPAATPSIGSQVNNGNGGFAFVNLRGLGSKRNIVILDGVRIVPAELLGRVDLNNIPLALVDRVDVLTGGASSTYGADAVSGVVNFITRSDFSGVELQVSDQITQRGDGNYIRGDLTLGANFDDGRGNAVISVGYQESDPVFFGGNDRPLSHVTLESYDEFFVAGQGSSTTTPSAFDVGGGLSRRQVSADGTTIVPFHTAFNFNPYNVFQTPFKRYNLFGASHYDISDHITAYARGMFSNNQVDTIIAPSGVFGNPVTFNISNPFLTDAQAAFFCSRIDTDPVTAGIQPPADCAGARTVTDPNDPNFQTITVGLRRRTPEVGPRVSSFQTQFWDFRAGLRGDITDNIGWDAFVTRGQSDQTQFIQGYVLLSRVQQSLLAVDTGDGPICIDAAGDPVEGCVPTNVFGVPGSITPEMVDFINDAATTRTRTRLSQGRATINGDAPFSSPWSDKPVGFAVGGEYRKYKAQQLSDVLAKTPGELGGAGGAAPDILGGYDVYEGFAEVIAPIVTDRPFFDELTLEAGIRRSKYTVNATETDLALAGITGGQPGFKTTTWKVAGSWAPVPDIKARATYNHAVRAPNISELFFPETTGLTNLGTDPCAGTNLNNFFVGGIPGGTLTTLGAVCVAQGAPVSQLGFIDNPTAGQANATFVGNLQLQPETANTWTVGAVLRPRFIPGLNATIDYYNIKIKDAITTPTPGDLIGACFGTTPTSPPAGAPTDPACLVIGRNPISGGLEGSPAEVSGLFAPLSNLGKLVAKGVDATINYRRDLGSIMGAPTKLNISASGNHTISARFQATPTSVDRECAGFYSVNCGPSAGEIIPKWTANTRATLSLGRADLSLLWRYIHKVQLEPLQLQSDLDAAIAAECEDPAGEDPDGCMIDPRFRKIKAHNYFDLSTRFNVNEHFDLTFTVMNLLDKDPPVVGGTVGTTTMNGGNTYPSTYDPLGRRFAASARIKF